MPVIISGAPVEVEHKDTGGGGRPPVHHRPTGGGGGGDENWESQFGRHGPHELLTRYRMGLGFALAGDLLFFIMLTAVFFVRQHAGYGGPDDPYILEWRPLTVPPILWINTAILVLSSLTMEMARRGVFSELDVMDEWLGLGRPTCRRALPWLVATAALGSLFIAGQCIAWKQLYAEGVFFGSNAGSHFFYLITSTHVLHLVLGVAAIAAAMVALRSRQRLEMRQIIVDASAWYWHVMGILWIFLFGLLLLAQ